MKDGQPVVMITGANGFIGQHLSPVLIQNGWIVRHAVRKGPGGDGKIVIGSLGPTTEWHRALVDVDAVVHLAARVHHQHEERAVELYRNVNTQGTLRLAQSAREAGVRQFVFVSTVLVHGRSNQSRLPFRESDVPTPQGVYGISKAEAEAGLMALAQTGDMQITIVRPPLVYGAKARGNFALLVRAVKLGIPLPFASINNHRAFLSVDNLTSFIAQRLSMTGRNFDVFLVADNEQVSTPEFIKRLARAAEVKTRLFPMSPPLLRALLKASGKQDFCESLIGSLELDVSKAASIGWTPPVSLDEGLRRALRTAYC